MRTGSKGRVGGGKRNIGGRKRGKEVKEGREGGRDEIRDPISPREFQCPYDQ